MRVCLVVGHSRKNKGAKNKTMDVWEFDFNNQIVAQIYDLIKAKSDLDVKIIFRDGRYSALPAKINLFKPDFVISMHCNAYNKRTTGCEMLYHHSEPISKKIAEILQEEITTGLPMKDRGAKGISSEDRGGLLLRETEAPCVIAEPFFIDNPSELKYVMEHTDLLVGAYVEGILKSAKLLEDSA